MTGFTRISIPTTRKPADVVRLAHLPERVGRSVVCLNGSHTAAGIDSDYNAFVREPTGIVERYLEHGFFRLDVSAPLDCGLSWQLGFFLAHLLHAEGRLFQSLDENAPKKAERVVWATGTVDSIGLRISPIGHIEIKAQQVLAAPEADLFILPAENAAELSTPTLEALRKRGIRIATPRNIGDALEILGLDPKIISMASDAKTVAEWSGSPWLGLETYDAQHRPIFFGRARAREEAAETLRRNAARGAALLVVHGRSGVGKSSLVRAGLVGDIVDHSNEGAPWSRAYLHFGQGNWNVGRFWSSIEDQMADLGNRAGSPVPLPQDVQQAPEKRIAALLDAADRKTLLLVLDQFEHFRNGDPAEIAALGATLSTLALSGRVWIVATLRTDRLDVLEWAPDLARLAQGSALFRLASPSLSELTQIIRAPAALAGFSFEAHGSGEDLADHLANLARNAPDCLPLLQVVLTRLVVLAGDGGRLTTENYERIGGFAGAVGRWADGTVAGMEQDGTRSEAVDQCLTMLVQIDEASGQADARAVDFGGLTPDQQKIMTTLTEARLVTEGEGRHVWLSHETLMREWPRLSQLVEDLRSDLILRDRIEAAATLWSAEGRSESDLLHTESRLEAAETLIEKEIMVLSATAMDFVAASRRVVLQERRRRKEASEARIRRNRRLALLAGTSAVVFAAIGAFAWVQRDMAIELAEVAEAEKQAAEASETRAKTAEQDMRKGAARLMITASRKMVDDGQTDQALLTLLEASRSFTAEDAPTDLLAAFDKALVRAAGETTYMIPADAEGFTFRNKLYFYVPSENALYLFDGSSAPRRIGDFTGKFFNIYDLLPEVGPVLAVTYDRGLRFHRFDPETGQGKVLADLHIRPSSTGVDNDDLTLQFQSIEVGADGIFEVHATFGTSSEYYGDSDLEDHSGWIGNLSTGAIARIKSNIGYDLTADESGHTIILADPDRVEKDDAAAIRTVGAHFKQPPERGGVYNMECLGKAFSSDAAYDFTWLISDIHRRAYDTGAFIPTLFDCRVSGNYLMALGDSSGSGGYSSRLWISNGVTNTTPADDGAREVDEIQIGLKIGVVEGYDLLSTEYPDRSWDNERTFLMFGGRELIVWSSKDASVDGPGKTLVMDVNIETAAVIAQEQIAFITEAAAQGLSKQKKLIIISLLNQNTLRRTKFQGKSVSDKLQDTIGIRIYAKDLVKSDGDVHPVHNKHHPAALDMMTVRYTKLSTDLRVPAALIEAHWYLNYLPEKDWYTVWTGQVLAVRRGKDGALLARWPVSQEPGHTFVKTERDGTNLLVWLNHKLWLWGPNEAGAWTQELVYNAPYPVKNAGLSPDGERLVVDMWMPGSDIVSDIIVRDSGELWRRIGDYSYKWSLSKPLTNQQVAYWPDAGMDNGYIFTLASFNDAIVEARKELSDACKFEGVDPTTSRCWRKP